jgi:phthalate 4,5-dioxygenase oxygenase subunit
MPNLPPEQDFRGKIKARAYQVAERGGLVYVYLGERETAPPFPRSRRCCARRKRPW